MTETILKINGMTCGHCAKHVHEALLKLPNVKRAVVDAAKGEAVVTHEGPLDPKSAAQAVEAEGYHVVQG